MDDTENFRNATKHKRVDKSPVDRLPPSAPEAEMGVLGCILLDPVNGINECAEAGLQLEWFFSLPHQCIFKGMTALANAGNALDLITLQGWLKDREFLEQVGGIAYLSSLLDQTPSAANLPAYLELVREKHLLRQLVRQGTAMVSGVYSLEDGERTSAAELLGRVEREILRLSEEGLEVREVRLKQIILNVIGELEDYHRGRAQMKGIGTGLEYLDKLLCGLGGKNGNYIVISGRPGTGKTSLATQIAEYAGLDYVWFDPVLQAGKPVVESVEGVERFKVERKVGVPVGIFTLEMASDALVQRMLFQRARADMQRWRTGFAVAGDFPPLTTAAAELAHCHHIYIDDAGRCTIDSLKAKARRMFRQYGIKLFIIDYIQLMRAGGRRFREDRVQELAEISGEIQSLGKELQVPIIVLAQMNRDYEKDPGRVPRLSDLKDCGSIEQDADLVGFLFGPKLKEAAKEKYERAMQQAFGDDWAKHPSRVDLLWAKNRYGPTGIVQLLFQRSSTLFLDYNVWLKEHGFKEPAQGERAAREDAEGLLSNQEMDL